MKPKKYTPKEHELADRMIQTLLDYGYSYEEMPAIFRMAAEKHKYLKENGKNQNV